jgi:pimeloyl-ACP methyl ester carboxylesterase
MKTAPSWVNKELFPFQSKWATVDGLQLHYIDEGTGDTLLFVHGTPEWSFGFRDVIRELRKKFRCVAVDHLGFGLSDKPGTADYSVQAHAQRLTSFIRELSLTDITLVVNDFGGGIGLSYALDHIDNIRSVVLFNTWLWSLKNDPHYSTPAKTINSWLGRFLYLRMNGPVNIIMPAAFGDRKKLTKEVHRHYKLPVPNAASRVALYEIARELMPASEWWQSLWERADLLRTKPMMILWGMKDKFVPPYEFEKWKLRFPHASAIPFPDAGHFLQEEEPSMAALIGEFVFRKSMADAPSR